MDSTRFNRSDRVTEVTTVTRCGEKSKESSATLSPVQPADWSWGVERGEARKLVDSILFIVLLDNISIMSYKVDVLFDGYSSMKDSEMKANCSCTLIRGEKNIIVDTMTPWDRDRIIEALSQHNLTPDKIDYVVCTHCHSDHVGNNNLFLNAKQIVGFSVSFKDTFFIHPFETGEPYIIDDNVKVVPTPGHTLADVTVLVKTEDKGTVAITGDLFEKEEDIENPHLWLHVAGSDDPELQRHNRNGILSTVDWIVPGHGPMFKVTQQMKKLSQDVIHNSDCNFHYI